MKIIILIMKKIRNKNNFNLNNDQNKCKHIKFKNFLHFSFRLHI